MAIGTVLFAAGMLERWSTGFASGGILGAGIGVAIVVVLKVMRSGR